jgi:hypothetical protein
MNPERPGSPESREDAALRQVQEEIQKAFEAEHVDEAINNAHAAIGRYLSNFPQRELVVLDDKRLRPIPIQKIVDAVFTSPELRFEWGMSVINDQGREFGENELGSSDLIEARAQKMDKLMTQMGIHENYADLEDNPRAKTAFLESAYTNMVARVATKALQGEV